MRLSDVDGDRAPLEERLLGAEATQPFVVGGRHGLANDKARADTGDCHFGRVMSLIIARPLPEHARSGI